MKGKMKKLVAFALATIMVLAMGITASAENKTITVTNTVKGSTYTLYKVFDVTSAGEGEDISYSYTIPDGSNLDITSNAFKDVFTTHDNGGKTYVTLNSGKTATQIANYLNAETTTVKGIEIESKISSNGENIIFTVSDPGYYYISGTTGTGAAAMLDTVYGENVTIIAKNDMPGWGDGGKTANGVTYNVGDTIHYTLSYEKALNYVDGNLIYQYVIKDTPAQNAGIKILNNTINIKVDNVAVVANGTAVTSYASLVNGLPTDDLNTNEGLDITLTWAKAMDVNAGETADTFYFEGARPATITVEYDAVLESLESMGDGGITNTASITYNEVEPDSTNTETETVYTGSITINKYDSEDNTKALKATFVVSVDISANGATTTKYLKYNANAAEGTSKYSEVDTVADATKFVTGPLEQGADPVENTVYGTALGTIAIEGLKAGDYKLVETEAPEGYNLLDNPQAYPLNVKESAADNNTMVQIAGIENSQGALLPSTGGIGTTIFYVVGGILVVGAGILLITKKRMSKSN